MSRLNILYLFLQGTALASLSWMGNTFDRFYDDCEINIHVQVKHQQCGTKNSFLFYADIRSWLVLQANALGRGCCCVCYRGFEGDCLSKEMES